MLRSAGDRSVASVVVVAAPALGRIVNGRVDNGPQVNDPAEEDQPQQGGQDEHDPRQQPAALQ